MSKYTLFERLLRVLGFKKMVTLTRVDEAVRVQDDFMAEYQKNQGWPT